MKNAISRMVRGVLVVALVTSTACKSKTSGTDPAASAAAPGGSAVASASASAQPPASAAASGSAAPSPDDEAATLMGRIAAEGRNRPAIKPNADDALAAFAKLGAPLTRAHPSLAASYHARFCTGGYADNEALAINVCEFNDDAAATAGLAFTNTLFTTMKQRKAWAHKATTLTIIEEKSDPGAIALEKKLIAAYQTL